jgi:hypothetical protein
VRIDRREILAECARRHEPLGMTVDDVLARGWQFGDARNKIDVNPCVHLKPGLVRAPNRDRERIEVGPRLERRRSRLERVLVVSVPTSPHLNQERVEAIGLRRCDHGLDACVRGQARSHDPQRAHFILRTDRTSPERRAPEQQPGGASGPKPPRPQTNDGHGNCP